MSNLADEFNVTRELALASQRSRTNSQHANMDREFADQRASQEHLISLMRPALKWEYDAWMTGFVLAGGKPTHFYDRPMATDEWFSAVSDFVITPLYGALALHVIVPLGVRFMGGDTGHSNVYITSEDGFLGKGFHDSAPHRRPRFVPVYTDTEVTP